MSVALLDVNMLVALFDTEHSAHDLANEWFTTRRESGWATCPITLNGCLRVLSSSAYRGRLEMADNIARLKSVTSRADHVFWSDSLPITADLFEPKYIRGPKQITDVYLLGLAVLNGCRLVTLDTSISTEAVLGATKDHLLILQNPHGTQPHRTL